MKEGDEAVTNCNGLKLKAKDGKYRITDVCDIEEMFRIIESIPSKGDKLSPIEKSNKNIRKNCKKIA